MQTDENFKYTELDSALLLWFRNARTLNIPTSAPILQSKAESFAKELCLETFLSSSGWLSRFKQRHDIQSEAVTSEQTDFSSQSCLSTLRLTIYSMMTNPDCSLNFSINFL